MQSIDWQKKTQQAKYPPQHCKSMESAQIVIGPSCAREPRILRDFITDNGHLTHEESPQLIHWLETLAKSGYPAGNDEVYDLASTICAKKYGPDFVLGKNWVKHWSEQFLPLVKKQVATNHDSIQGHALNLGTVQHWFEMVGKVFKDHDIKPENIYGVDETGIHINDFGKHKVFVPVNMKQVYMQTDAVWESFTLLVLTCANHCALCTWG